jgi:lipoprotein-releasing system ATP-binding protein
MIVELQNICKSYKNQMSGSVRDVLKNIDLTVSKGDLISVVGPSGCGKSTLLNIIGTMDNPDSGNVNFQGRIINDLNSGELAVIRNKKIGFVFQQHHLLPQLSLMENVLLPLITEKDKKVKTIAMNRAKELISWVGLADVVHQFPSQLSVGECQRAAVVRALINEPEIILADEPTGSLDEKSAMELVDLLISLNAENGQAVVMVTHASKLAEKMKKMYQLSNGSLIQV